MNPYGIATRPLIDPVLLAEYNRGVERAVRAYREAPNALITARMAR